MGMSLRKRPDVEVLNRIQPQKPNPVLQQVWHDRDCMKFLPKTSAFD